MNTTIAIIEPHNPIKIHFIEKKLTTQKSVYSFLPIIEWIKQVISNMQGMI
jgi:hypothetical protein